MTGHQIDNFVGSLVEMAKAFEERPHLQEEIRGYQNDIARVDADNQALRDSNDILRQHITTLESKIVEVTKERDDAGFRCLEADDKAARILDLARTLASGLGQVIAEVEPPKPAEPITDYTDYVVPMHVTTQEPVSVQEDPTSTTTSEPVSTAHVDTPSSGQSEPNPTAAVNIGETLPSAGQSPVPNSDATSTETVVSADKPYAGKRWSELAFHEKTYSRDEWFAGGGDQDGWVS